jgi:UDP-N-acetyl-D-galactosamine dehydrogenase
MHEYGITVHNELPKGDFGAAVLAVAHKEFELLNVRKFIGNGIIYDVKGVLPKEQVDARL